MKKLIGLTIFFILILTTQGSAEPLKASTYDLGIEIGFETSHITYEEPGVMEDKGIMYGVNCSLTYRDQFPYLPVEIESLMLRLEGRASFGEVDYTSESSGNMDNIEDYMLEFRGLVGYDSYISRTIITPYIGYGYRYLNDDSSGMISSTGSYGYEREISYLYSPIGIVALSKFGDEWSLGLRLEFDYFWDGDVKSNMSSVSGYYDIENDQDDGYGYRGSVRLRKTGEDLDFIIELFARYWSIDESEPTTDPAATTWYEPKNNSKEIGINFAALY